MGKLPVRVRRRFGGCFEVSPPKRHFSTKFWVYSSLNPNLRVRITFRQLSQVLFGMVKLPVSAKLRSGGCFEFSPPKRHFSTKFWAYSALTPNL
ncbi:unnamed protein product [Camellia sinensis]